MTETTPTLNLLDRPEIPEDVKMLLRVIPGQEQTEQGPPETAPDEGQTTEPYCPPWATVTDPASDESFSVEGQRFIAPAVHEEPNPMLYPMCTVGIVYNSNGRRGSGVLVGPNLLLTAGHVAPRGAASWSMEFVPAYRNGARPFGSSFVQTYHGYNTNGSVTGYDYIICKLFNPLGRALGWMGAASFGNEDEYYNKRFVSSGYPGTYGDRPAVELDMGVRDIDNDSPGKEIEFALRADLGPGWSGGPLWHHTANPYCVGVLSGQEKDGLDPTRLVYAGGGALVDLVRHGQSNWPG
ncbi:serine protease [Pseudarthrobacter sp. NBSH8]|uniref:trypsin-like serine peptidase n=1 Tax=Pseudarthrobacter sp. NBSH8 TaxID=2596911 RepID=UPI001627259E|nr:trypsin-like peptidase domain-containing protein [Pseudarthrobacter sp. NBSH8]QNE14461.1 trypsin-like serine protease [Pseudarthrobacter sp. NBSH8]